MKKYIKPEIEMTAIEIQNLLNIASAEGADGLSVGSQRVGGTVDSRESDYWDE